MIEKIWCPYCDSYFYYDQCDICYDEWDDYYYIDCPFCGLDVYCYEWDNQGNA